MKKKVLMTALALLAAFSLFACGKDPAPDALAAPGSVTVAGTALTWSAVDGADSYTVAINDATVTGIGTTSLELTAASVVPHLKEGDNTCKVKAVKGDLESAWSDAVTYRYEMTRTQLTAPVIALDESDPLAVVWQAVPNASGYKLKIDGAEIPGKITATRYAFDPAVASATIAVKAVGEGAYTDSPFSNELQYVNAAPQLDKLSAPVLSVSGKTVSWTDVEGAASYEVSVNGGTFEAAVSPFVLAETNVGTYAISVVAVPAEPERYARSDAGETTVVIEKLPAPVLNVTGRTITWTDDPKAIKYQAKVGDGAYADVTAPWTLPAEPGDFVVTVKAIGDGVTLYDSDEATTDTISVVRLAVPTGLSYTAGVLAWTGTAESYRVVVTKDGAEVFDETVAAASKRFDFTAGGEYVFTVTALGDGVLTLDSTAATLTETITQKQKLGTPAVSFTSVNKMLSWQNVSYAGGYTVEVKRDGTLVAETSVTGSSYSFTYTQPGKYTLRVKATSSDPENYVDGDYSAAVEYTLKGALTAPVLTTEGNVVTWQSVENADKYNVTVNGVQRTTVTTTSYTLPATVGEWKVKVVAVSERSDVFTDSPVSNEVTVSIVKLTVSPVRTGRTVSWTLPQGAVKAQVKINDGAFADATENSVTVDAAAGTYTVTVKVIGDGALYLDSDAATVTVTVVKLDAPTLTADPTDGRKITWTAVTDASGYEVSLDGQTWTSQTELSYAVAVDGPGSYKLYVRTIGDTDDLLTSDAAETTVTVTRLDAPTGVAYNEATGTLSWTGTSDRYRISYSLNGGEAVNAETDATSYALGLSEAGTYTVTVTVLGDEKTVLSSVASAPLTVEVTAAKQKLTTPVVTDTVGVLTWSAVADAAQYEITLSGAASKTFTVTEDGKATYTFDLTAEATLVAGNYAVQVRALPAAADETHAASDAWTGSYKKTVQLGTTVITVAGHTVSWTAVPNAQSYSLYTEKSSARTLVAENLTSPVYTFENLTEPFIGSLVVVAVGDGDIYLNSETTLENVTLSIDLAMPIVTRNDQARKFTVDTATGVSAIKVSYQKKGAADSFTTYSAATGIPYGETGEYTLKVYYQGKTGYNDSLVYTKNFTVLNTPENIVINKDKISFDAIEGVESYKMVNNGGAYSDFAVGASLPAGMNRFYIYAAAPSNNAVLPSEGRYYTALIINSVATFNLITKSYEKDENNNGANNMWGVSSLIADIPDPTGIVTVGTADNAYSTNYNGTFLGNGYQIGSASTPLKAPLLMHNYGTVKDLKLYVAISDTTGTYVGGLAKDNLAKIISGETTKAQINNVTVYGTVTAQSYVGGIVGANCSDIFGAINRATVTGTGDAIGGIAGINKAFNEVNGYMNRVQNFGAVKGGSNVGGIVGQLAANVIDGAYNGGAVTTPTNGWGIGGIAGITLKDTKIFEALNTGSISTANKGYNNGGLVGKFGKDTDGGWENSLLFNSVNLGAVYTAGEADSAGSLAGVSFVWSSNNPAKPADKYALLGGYVNTAYLTGTAGVQVAIGKDNNSNGTANATRHAISATFTQAQAQALAVTMNAADLSADDVFTVAAYSSGYVVVPAWCAGLI